MLRLIALVKKIAVSFQGILQCCGVAVLRGQPVSSAEHPGAALDGQGRTHTPCIFDATAGIAATMKVQNDTLAALVLGDDPGTGKLFEGMVLDDDMAAQLCAHQFAHLLLALAQGIQRDGIQQGLQQRQLLADPFGR